MITIAEAAARGIERLRMKGWASPCDHIKIHIIGGQPGAWMHLFAPFNKECNGCDPVTMLLTDFTERVFVPYTGPLPGSPEYEAEVARFEGCITHVEGDHNR